LLVYLKDILQVILFALIAIEKYSLSSNYSSFIHELKLAYDFFLLKNKDMNKISIMNKLTSSEENVLIRLSEWKYDENNLKHQIGFLAQNLLDNSCKLLSSNDSFFVLFCIEY
jgi:poly(3-hydroxyalkanoate) synthetase